MLELIILGALALFLGAYSTTPEPRITDRQYRFILSLYERQSFDINKKALKELTRDEASKLIDELLGK